MKTIKASIILLLVITGFAFRPTDKDLDKCLIDIGETISFSNKPACEKCKSMMNMKRGAYDGSKFELKIDTANNIILSDVSPADGPKQDEFGIYGCTGSLTRNKEGVTFTFEKVRKNYYLINIKEGVLVGSFENIKSLSMRSETEDGKQAQYFCSEKDNSGVHFEKHIPKDSNAPVGVTSMSTDPRPITTIDLTAVPAGMKKSDLYTATHAPNTIAHFTNIEIELADGMKMPYPSGSYLLVEGSALAIK